MREVDCMVWDKKRKAMFPARSICTTGGVYVMTGSVSTGETGHYIWIGEGYVLRQYTGLRDKKAQKIYEGDVVRVDENWEAVGIVSGEVYEVYFAFGGFRLKPKYTTRAMGYWVDEGEFLEVIGNIYESPELRTPEPGDIVEPSIGARVSTRVDTEGAV